jgi:hypothetical protein
MRVSWLRQLKMDGGNPSFEVQRNPRSHDEEVEEKEAE